MKQNATLSILFADIVGSTRLYELLGDTMAESAISTLIARLCAVLPRHQGRLIKTIGDEVMCAFPSASEAIDAAIDMQLATEQPIITGPGRSRKLEIRIGLNHGPVILEDDDAFGDTVNIAARIASLANGKQIFTTEETINVLPEDSNYSLRSMDALPLRGKQINVQVFEVLWQTDDVTEVVRLSQTTQTSAITRLLHILYHDSEFYLDTSTEVTTMGRGEDCDITVDDDLASRRHVIVEQRNGKFILRDVSTNGTYVESDSGCFYLKREEIILSGRGRISLGRNFRKEKCEVLTFDLVEAPSALTN